MATPAIKTGRKLAGRKLAPNEYPVTRTTIVGSLVPGDTPTIIAVAEIAHHEWARSEAGQSDKLEVTTPQGTFSVSYNTPEDSLDA